MSLFSITLIALTIFFVGLIVIGQILQNKYNDKAR